MPQADLGIKDLQTPVGLTDPVVKALHDNKVVTLTDIRRQGGVPDVQGLTSEMKRSLEAHAYLSLITDHPDDIQILINAGMTGIAEIAAMAGGSFVRKAKAVDVTEERAKAIHAKAWAANAFMANVVTSASRSGERLPECPRLGGQSQHG